MAKLICRSVTLVGLVLPFAAVISVVPSVPLVEAQSPALPPELEKVRAALSHYDLHVWLWTTNPAGLFSPTNPTVKCSGYGYRLSEEAPELVPHP